MLTNAEAAASPEMTEERPRYFEPALPAPGSAPQSRIGKAGLDADVEAGASPSLAASPQSDFARFAITPAPVQRKSAISSPGDLHEREADEVADKVMTEPMPIGSATTTIQRSCAGCEDAEQKPAQTNHAPSANAETTGGERHAMRVTEQGGAPMPGEARDFFESRFGHDFSMVRVHVAGEAADAARALQARAYTVGHDIVFGKGEYAPATSEGKRLLAHELTHVIQQQRSHDPSSPTIQRQSTSSPERVAFEAAVRAGQWETAYRTLNGLSMLEMTHAVDELPVASRDALIAHRTAPDVAPLVLNWPRIDYALTVVRQGTLPAPVGNLAATGQVADAANFISARLTAHIPGGAAHVSLILQACRDAGIVNPSHIAYVLATANLETQGFARLLERGSRAYFIQHYDGVNGNVRGTEDPVQFRGRGFIQLTGRGLYRQVGTALGLDLENNPDLAADPSTAARILAVGMRDGLFRRSRLADFDTPQGFRFRDARAIVNAALDRADDIRRIAIGYQRAMAARTSDEGTDW
jgi:hypothetical protein